jgi:hypothetical protein
MKYLLIPGFSSRLLERIIVIVLSTYPQGMKKGV